MLYRTHMLALLAPLALAAPVWSKGKPTPVTCPTDVPAALAAACPCDGLTPPNGTAAPWRNHGQYASCMARFRNTLRKGGCLTDDLKRTIVRCAARSTCGKNEAVLCCTSEAGTCNDPTPEDTTPGTCSNDPTKPCVANGDCVTMRVRVSKDMAACAADGGVAAGAGSVCTATCPTPAP